MKAKRNMLIILSLFLIMAVFMGCVSAGDDNAALGSDIVVDQNTNEILAVEESSAGEDVSGLNELENENLGENRSVEGNTFEDIQTAIANSNPGDTIILNGLYTGSGTQINVDKYNLTFIGENNATLDAKGLSRIINIDYYGKYITLKNISFINGYGYDGGAIFWNGDNGTVSGCSFENNTGNYGSAIYWNGVNGTVSGCSFENNTASYNGAISWNGVNGTVSGCSFVNNTADDGGAINWWGINGTVSGCSFVNNSATYEYGGAIAFRGYYSRVFNCTFENNSANFGGGAIHINGYNITVFNCSFMNNSAYMYGGALFIYENSTINDCSFVNNYAVQGGGAITFDGSIDTYLTSVAIISNCSFENNTATGEIGGSAVLSVVKLIISDSKFIDNKCLSISLELNNNSLTFKGMQNYINAINTFYEPQDIEGDIIVDMDVVFDNVTFWNGDVVNSDDVKPNKSNQEAGINITVEFYDSTGALVKNVTHMTNASGQLLLDYSGLSTGDYTVKAYHIEDAYYTYIETTGSFSLKNYNIVVLNNQTLNYDETPVTVRLNATIEDSETGAVINPDSVKLIFVLSNGTEIEATYSEDGYWYADWTFENGGNYTVTAKLNETEFKIGDDYYTLADTLNGTVSIPKNSTYDIGIAVDNVTYPDSAVINVTVPSDVTGNVTVNINGTDYPTQKVNDTTYQAVVPLEPGVYTVNATVSDDPKYADKTSDNKEFTVEDVAHIEAEDMKRGWDSPYDYLAKLVDAKGNPVSGQTLIFTVNGKEYEAVTDSEGVAKLTTSKLAVGVYDVTVTNPATGENVTKKVTIVKRLLENANLVKDFEGPQGYKVLAIGDDGNAVGAGVVVVMKVNGVTYKIKTDKNGYATLPIHLNPKSYVITATYHKTTVSNKIVVRQTMKLVKPAVTVQKGKAVVLSAVLKWSNGKAIAGKVIKFNFRGKIYQAKTASNGLAKVTIPAKVTQGLKKGATYAFSATYIKNIVKGKVTIK